MALLLSCPPAWAHIALSQPTFETGQNYAAFFKLDGGCDGSPTTALRVEIPAGVTVLQMPSKPGWTLSSERNGERVSAVTWRGRLDAKAADQFGLFLKLPAEQGTLYFPAVQDCEKGRIAWTQASADAHRAAPMLQLIAAKSAAAPAHYMTGNIMIEQVWSPATPGGATTAAVYMTVMNHGSTPDTLLGGTTSTGGKLEIHQMSGTGRVMSMRPVPDGLTIPPGGTVVLGPQGPYHGMLLGLRAPLVQGTRLPATLTFAKAGPVRVDLEIAAIGARAPAASKGAMPGMEHH
jgi:copper(I)-binding protein